MNAPGIFELLRRDSFQDAVKTGKIILSDDQCSNCGGKMIKNDAVENEWICDNCGIHITRWKQKWERYTAFAAQIIPLSKK